MPLSSNIVVLITTDGRCRVRTSDLLLDQAEIDVQAVAHPHDLAQQSSVVVDAVGGRLGGEPDARPRRKQALRHCRRVLRASIVRSREH